MAKQSNYMAEQRYVEMKTGMLLHTPFFASLLLDVMSVKIGKFPGVETAGTNGRIIWFDEDFLAKLDLPEAVFVCCHEVAHAMWSHMPRALQWKESGLHGQPFRADLYNMAADYVVNDMLVNSKIGRMPKIGLLDSRFNGSMLVEDVYKELMKDFKSQSQSQPSSGNGPPAPEGSNGTPSRDGQPMDTHVYEMATIPESQLKRAIATAAHQAKAMGKMPSQLERWVGETLDPQVNWKERLRRIVVNMAGRDATTWASPHRRRLVTQRVYLPSYTGFGAGEIVCAVDTSGSMGSKEFDAAWAEFSDIIMTCRPERVWLMSCDARVHDVHELPSYTDIYQSRPQMHGGGGTSFIPVFDKVEELGLRPAALVYFTDGMGTFPHEPPPYPVIWVMTEDGTPPFGENIKVEMNDYER